MKKVFTFLTVSAFLTCFACGGNEKYADLPYSEEESFVMLESMFSEKSIPTDSRADGIDETLETAERKIIKEGSVSFDTPDIGKTYATIVKHVSELNGYLSNEIARDDLIGYLRYELTIRIPADNFDTLLQRLSENSGPFVRKSVGIRDVTAEYIDVEARIKTKKELKSRYEALLKQASKVEEMLQIEREIGELQAEIESVEGRMKKLADQIAYSTLTVSFYQKISTQNTFGFGAKLLGGLKSGWENFLWFVVGLSHIWVFIIVVTALIYFIRKRNRRKKIMSNKK